MPSGKIQRLEHCPIPNRPDYIFDGWYTELNGENRVTSPTVITGDMILYAHWTADVPQDPIEAFVARLYKEILAERRIHPA